MSQQYNQSPDEMGLGMRIEHQFDLITGLTSGQMFEQKMLTLRKTGNSPAIVAIILRYRIVKYPTRDELHDLREDILLEFKTVSFLALKASDHSLQIVKMSKSLLKNL